MYTLLNTLFELTIEVKNNSEKDFFTAQSWSAFSSQSVDNTDNISQI